MEEGSGKKGLVVDNWDEFGNGLNGICFGACGV